MKLFISYRSLDSEKVDKIVARLRSLKTSDGSPRYTLWQDKYSIPDGHDWWEAIVDAIIDCQVFIFMVSRESVQNANCRAELRYARKRNRPVLPIILEDEFFYNDATGKNDIDYWESIPQELIDLRAQFLFYEGTSFISGVERALNGFAAHPERWRDIPAERPLDPRADSNAGNDSATLYNEAYDYALRMEFETAERRFQKLVNLGDPDFAEDAADWISLMREYQQILKLDSHDSTRHRVSARWEKYQQQFPKPFISLFDPKGLQSRFGKTAEDYVENGKTRPKEDIRGEDCRLQ